MFAEALRKHEEYKRRRFSEDGKYSPYDAEIWKKIAQLDWLIAKAAVLNEKIESKGSDVDVDALWELEITTESFYYFVGRLTEIFKQHPRFDKVPQSMAERVRHQLLQHPEKMKARKDSPAFECGGSEGPKIRSYRGPEGALVDRGLFENAREFNSRLVYVFEQEAKNA